MAGSNPDSPGNAFSGNASVPSSYHERQAPSRSSSESGYLRDRFVETFLSQNKRAQTGLVIAAAVIALIWAHAGRSSAPLVWWLAVAAVGWWRFRYTHSWVEAAPASRRPDRIRAVLVLNGCALAIPLVDFGAFSISGRAAVTLILIGAATASVATTAGYRYVFVAFAAPMMAPLAAAWALNADASEPTTALGFALLVLLHFAFLMGVAQRFSTVFIEAAHYRHAEDLQNQKLAEALDETEAAAQSKSRFLAAASHDLRQPLHSMSMLIAALSLDELPAESRQVVRLLETAHGGLTQQLDTLLDMSKLDAGAVTAACSALRLDEMLVDLHAMLLPRALSEGKQLIVHPQPLAAAWVDTDPGLLRRVLLNLLDNALKFTPLDGRITLGLEPDADEWVVSVTDTGIGIDSSEMAHVFEEFYQVGNPERDRMQGLGLGLSIVQRLTRLLQIPLAVASRPGEGTRVTLRLPSTASPALPAPPTIAQAAAMGKSVLVVDDEPLVREGMGRLLTAWGCRVHASDSLQGAVHIAAHEPLDVLLCDLRLRGRETGLAVVEAVRRRQPRVLAALITGDTAPERMRMAQAAGLPLLHKPVSASALADLLAGERPPRQSLTPGSVRAPVSAPGETS